MKLHPAGCFKLLVVTLLALSWSGLGTSAATDKKEPATSTNKSLVVEVPKSVFNPVQGRNPFFPASSVPPIQPGTTGTQSAPKPNPLDLVLNGIVPKGDKPTAMINSHTFEEGETGEVRIANGNKILIKCEEIRADSVIISIDGQKRELKLRFGL